MISKVELLHHRLQEVLRKHTFSGNNSLEYLGEDERGHKYRIAGNEVYVDQIAKGLAKRFLDTHFEEFED
tara:strand:+ start:4049 stop:4258 length:210 start_codon:yes stop_codon:yes gene_type:complete